ncbi:MAG: MFS transporter [Taibaiella sp.]|nr:MFS transporter [Taibaiella sp.]
MKDYTAICACTFLLAILNESFRPANSTAIAHYSNDDNRTRCYSLNRLSINLGWALGSALGGFIASRNYQLLFWIDGLTNIGAALLLRTVLSPTKNTQTPNANPEKQPKQKGQSAYTDKIYIGFAVLTILYAISFFQWFTTVPVFFNQQLRLSSFFIGSVMAMNGLIIALIEMVLVFKMEQQKKNLTFVFAGVILTALSFLVFNMNAGAVVVAVVATIIVTFGEMLSMPFMNTFMISRTNSANRGQYAGLYTAAWSIAQICGPFFSTRIVEKYGFTVLWWLVGGVGVVTAFGFKVLQYKTEQEKAAQADQAL